MTGRRSAARDWPVSCWAAALHCPPEEAPLRYDAQGKPLTDGLYLSISHSRGLAACAVADRRWGWMWSWCGLRPAGMGASFPGGAIPCRRRCGVLPAVDRQGGAAEVPGRPVGAAAGAGVLPDAGGLRPAGLCLLPGAAAGGLDRHPVSGGKTDIGPARCSIGWFRGGTA